MNQGFICYQNSSFHSKLSFWNTGRWWRWWRWRQWSWRCFESRLHRRRRKSSRWVSSLLVRDLSVWHGAGMRLGVSREQQGGMQIPKRNHWNVIFSGSAQLSQTSTAFIPRPTSALRPCAGTLGQRLMIRTPGDLYGICMGFVWYNFCFFHGDPWTIQFSFQAIYDWPWYGFLYRSFCSKPHAFL